MSMTMIRVLIGVILSTATTFGQVEPNRNGSPPWYDTFYQYRMPLAIDYPQRGRHLVPLTGEQITSAINQLEEMAFDPRWFDYNQVKLVEVDESGGVIDADPDIRYHMIPVGEELVGSEVIGNKQTVTVPTEAGALYLLRYTYEGSNLYYSPAGEYDNTLLSRVRPHKYEASYEPKMLPQGIHHRERLLLSDGSPMELTIESRFVTGLRKISLTRARIDLVTNTAEPGLKRYMLYYQPFNGYNLSVPEPRLTAVPGHSATVAHLGRAEKNLGSTQYRLDTHASAEVWFADSTVKLTPHTPPPPTSSTVIRVTAAANEKQSFQVVLKPIRPFTFGGITATDLSHASQEIDSSNVTVSVIEYVPISVPSDITPVRYTGMMGDPLSKPTVREVDPEQGNFALWVTVRVPSGTAHGIYRGNLTIAGSTGDADITLPLEVEVYDMELPAVSSFRSSMGGSSITKTLNGLPDGKNIADYHHAQTQDEIRQLARNYYTLMAEHKFTPNYALLHSPIGMKWSPSPDGFNVDTPGNFFTLYDWNFAEFNKDAAYYIDELGVNNITLVHTNPSYTQMFKHLPGETLKEYERNPGWLSMSWQVFREATWVGLKPNEGDPYREISQAQYDRLILDFYRPIAINLAEHGWLDKIYLLIDETHYRGFDEYLHFLRLLESDPYTARLRIAWCLQSADAYTHREPDGQGDRAFHGLIDNYVPDWRENYNWWESYYFTDNGIQPDRDKLWLYNTETVRSAIDCPGINNRATAMHVFHQGGSGFLRWSTFDWDRYRSETDNPWTDPWTDCGGNGALAYFYPPRKDGPSSELDLTVTPSLRVVTYGEGVDDYEYARMLEQLIAIAREKGVEASDAQSVLADIDRFFYNAVQWSQNDAWYLDLRDRIARAIVDLRVRLRE